jgi:hypothetical protein
MSIRFRLSVGPERHRAKWLGDKAIAIISIA